MALVTREAQNVASNINRSLDERQLQAVGFISLATAGGALIAQEVAERVLVALDRPRDPTSPTNIGISALTKVVAALGVGAVSTQLGGLGAVVAAFVAVGHLVSAGVDLFDVLQRGGIPGQAPSGQGTVAQGGSGNRQRVTA